MQSMFLGDNNIQIAIDTSTVSIQIHYGKIVDIKNVLDVFSLKKIYFQCVKEHKMKFLLSFITHFVHLNFLHQEVNQFTYNVLKWTLYTYQALNLMPLLLVQVKIIILILLLELIKIHMKLSNSTIGWPISIFFV